MAQSTSSTAHSLLAASSHGMSLSNDIGCMTCLSDTKKANHFTSHCPTCDVCVIDKDVHITFLGNCSGKGNRRYVVLFVLFGWICLAVYLYANIWTFGHYMCPAAKGIVRY